MSRRNNTVKLPHALEKELGLEVRTARGQRRNGVAGRKERRKAQRVEKKVMRSNGGRRRPQQNRTEENEENEDDDDEEDEQELPVPVIAKKKIQTKPSIPQAQFPQNGQISKPKPVLKTKPRISPSPSSASDSSSSRSSSPGLVLDANSKAFKERAAQDDDEILALEKKLGLKSKKLPKSFDEDGLGGLLDGCDEEEPSKKRKSEEKEWLERKRRKAYDEVEEDQFNSEDTEVSHTDEGSNVTDEFGSDLEAGDSENSDENVFEGFDQDGSDIDTDGADDASDGEEVVSAAKQAPRVRENPYVAPISANGSSTKYVPPSLRKQQDANGPSAERLIRQIQGHLNKLSEANLISILGEIEKLYQTNPRQDVTSSLIDLLLSLFCSKAALSNTFVILHAAFAVAVYKVIGTDFGAELLEKLVERFDEQHISAGEGKESLNLISLLSNLFTFHLVGSTIIFDHVRLLLEDLNEINTELLLRVVRDCGPQLRQDDPASLKNIVQMMQASAKRVEDVGDKLSVRTKFMMETITDLKNNKMKEATNAAGATREHITRMRKALGSLNNRNLRASEPLRISRTDIKNSDKKGKWWLVGASWKGTSNSESVTHEGIDDQRDTVESDDLGRDSEEDENLDLLSLARQYRMNTSVRQSIFIAIMSASNYQDAFLRLSKLRLKKRSQEPEIAKVLVRCVGVEEAYNPYYSLLAKRLIEAERGKRMKKTFEFASWSFFRRLGENLDEDEDETDQDDDEDQSNTKVPISELVNVAKFFTFLITNNILSLSILKILDLAYLKEKTEMWVEFLLVTIFTELKDDEGKVEKIFGRARESPQIVQRLRLFLRKKVRNSDLVGKKEREVVRNGCRVAMDVLEAISLGQA